jgi:hypothetical protein
LARHLAPVLPIGRRAPGHCLPGILRAVAARLPRDASLRARPGRRRARNEEYDAGRAGGFCDSSSALPNSQSRAGSPATISRMIRAATSLSVFIGRFEALGEGQARPNCTAGPAPAVLGLVSACGDIDLTRLDTASIALSGRASCVRGMSTGRSRRTLSNNEHDTKTTDKANESSCLPAFSFRWCEGVGAHATERNTECASCNQPTCSDAFRGAGERRIPFARFYRTINPIWSAPASRINEKTLTAAVSAVQLPFATGRCRLPQEESHDISVALGRQRKSFVR